MAEAIENIRQNRIDKLEKIKKLGVEPYAPRITLGERENIASVREKEDSSKALVAGRIFGWRGHGKLIFADLKDSSAQIQILFKSDLLEPLNQQLVALLDLGDFIAVSGKLFTTKAGELTIEVSNLQLLSKSLRPIPSAHFGVEDTETRFRQRYLDLLVNEEVRERFKKRTIITRELRNPYSSTPIWWY